MIKAFITDFDGTLVDTFEANLRAYQQALYNFGVTLTAEKYRECFGLRFDTLMSRLGIFDSEVVSQIREQKQRYYPNYFHFLKPNAALIELLSSWGMMGAKVAIASTARKENLMNVVEYLGIGDLFDLIVTGQDVKKGKPDPEVYVHCMNKLDVLACESIIFEDSDVGIEAAKRSGAKYIRVTPEWFDK